LALRWMTFEKVLGVGVVRHWLYLAAKAFGVNPIKRCLVTTVGGGASSGNVKPPGLDI
jgi:hypothetical protein